jgi:hypothetical protein
VNAALKVLENTSPVLDVVCWKWKPARPYRSTYDGKAVNVLRNMVARHYLKPHRFSCITDDASGIDTGIRIIPLQHHFADVANPSNIANPSCYRRLWGFSEEAREVIGERFVSLDLDVVITNDISPLFDRTEDFVIWGGQALGPGRLGSYNWYNGSFWKEFDPKVSPMKAHMAGNRGSDQGWIAYALGPKQAMFGKEDGIHSFRNHIQPNNGKLFGNTRIVVFHGKHDPWHADIQTQYPWIKEHYR